MNRRDLLKLITAATGTAMIGGTGALAGCAFTDEEKAKSYRFTERDVQILDELAETILPRTDTPGAKDAGVGEFMTVFVRDCYTPEEQALFHSGLPQLEARSQDLYQRGFLELSAEQREGMVRTLDQEAREQVVSGREPHYFTLMKQLTLFGFFTSEKGATEVLRYIAIPGRYDGCAPYEEGQRAWAT